MDAAPIKAEFLPGADTLVIAFTGMREPGANAFAFEGDLASAPASKLFLRDPTNCWYLGGLEGVGAGVEGLRDALRRRIDESGARRVRCVGASMGGFAALLYGALLRVDGVCAIAPHVFLDPARRDDVRDVRWRVAMRRVHTQHILSRRYWSADRVIERECPGLRIDLYFGKSTPMEAAHAAALRKLRNVSVNALPAPRGASLLKLLREQGRLAQALIG